MQTETPNLATKPAVLFLCTGNSARGVLAEFLFRSLSGGRFRVESAGSHPTGRVNPHALSVLQKAYSIDASAARSKRLDELPHEPFSAVITLCDNAAAECPVWPYPAARAHWPFPDPAAVEGTVEEKEKAFRDVAQALEERFRRLLALPFEIFLDRLRLEAELRKLST
ncbi:arsenate reductase ArsC [Verrucomicrobium sp. 3C]|uniref:arsenate reductase ArsC n=1 Tax=Verrucomicrobium sp. 3C TaxID=1134055 RepID=UPI0003645E86|nr:arsenate reductase ArsC [Verrucomicrobium sp. 3C]